MEVEIRGEDRNLPRELVEPFAPQGFLTPELDSHAMVLGLSPSASRLNESTRAGIIIIIVTEGSFH